MKSKQKGITLIALVITIIVLLILAGVSIAMLTGENGILNRAKEASEKTDTATDKEQRQLAMYEASMNTSGMKFQGIDIPAGFAPTRIAGESTVNEGLVIVDSEGNEFVWIPVESGYMEKKNENLNDEVSWERQEYEEMKESVEQYGGFYIGRYEAGSTTERKGYQKEGNGTTKMVVQRDQYPYNWVCWGVYEQSTNDYSGDAINTVTGDPYEGQIEGKGAVYLCRHMYDGKSVGVKSTLCYEAQWNAVTDFIKKHDFNTDSNSTNWGNYCGIKFEITRKSAKKIWLSENNSWKGLVPWESAYGAFGADNCGYLLTTGASDRNKAANLYDVAGNCGEWLMSVKTSGTERYYKENGRTKCSKDSRFFAILL